MTIFLNGLLLWITISCCISCPSANGSNIEKEEADFYESLKRGNNDDSKEILGSRPRNKRSDPEELNERIYESEVKVIGRVVDGGARTRVERASGDNDFSISETPIDPNVSYQDPNAPEINHDESMTVVSTVGGESLSKDTPDIPADHATIDTGKSDEKSSDNESDFGTGIEVESEEKLAEEDRSNDQDSPQSTGGDEITLMSRSTTMEQILWPSGTYGLPRPLSGCPESSGFTWSSGVRFYDTEDDGTENHNSEVIHLAGDVTEDGITLEFCMKTKDVGLKSWPSGKYCIYKKGRMCPDGLRSGFVYWDDESGENKNFYDGTLPEGTYTDKTKIRFCCSDSGNAKSAITLPTDKPFYLFPHGSSTCQKVRKMRSTLEFVKFDEEDKGAIEKSAGGFYPYGIHPQEKDHTFYMCYYELEDQDDLPLESGVTNSKKIAHSERIIHEFMKVKETNERDEIAKEQISRTGNARKFPNMQASTYHAIVIATGFVLTTIAILVGALLVISYFTKRWTRDLKKPRSCSRQETKKLCKELITQEEEEDEREERGEQETFVQERCNDIEFVETEIEQEEEELVEDQFLPSDSQLKSGLEFLFLKQQKRKWLARNNRNK